MPEYTRPPILKQLSIAFVILVIIVLLSIAYFFVGKAEITITPAVKPVSTTFTVTVAEDTQPNEETLPGIIFSEDISEEKTFPVSDFNQEEIGQATGQITIVNDNSSSQTLVAETRFLTPDNILFRLDNRVVIPAGSSITANVTAEEPGASGDISGPLQLSIPGLSPSLQQLVYGQVNTSFSGGIKKIGTLTESDITNARETVVQEILEKTEVNYLSNYLTAQSTSTPVLAPDIRLDLSVSDENVSAAAGDLVDTFDLTLEGVIHGVAYNKNNLEILAQNRLKGSLAQGERFLNVTPGSFEISLIEINPNAKEATLQVSIAGQSLYTQDSSFVDTKALTGKTRAELIEYFSTVPGVETVEVTFWPFWVHTVPRVNRYITISIENVR